MHRIFTYSKRAMALDQIASMRALGFDRFAVAGHDRGGRVGYRLALDYPDVVSALAVLDIVPTADVWAGADAAAAMRMYHWYFLARPRPLPETLIGGHRGILPEAHAGKLGGQRLFLRCGKPRRLRRLLFRSGRDPCELRGLPRRLGCRPGARRGRPRQQADQGAAARHLVGGVRRRPSRAPKKVGRVGRARGGACGGRRAFRLRGAAGEGEPVAASLFRAARQSLTAACLSAWNVYDVERERRRGRPARLVRREARVHRYGVARCFARAHPYGASASSGRAERRRAVDGQAP